MPTAKEKVSKSKEPKSYKEAMEELEEIVSQVDDRNADIDLLATKVKRAHELLEYCQSRIEAVRFEVENVFETSSEEK
ncbi:MAG TPA: exodeoxyribonuclease VII small subunit [Acidimicrobiia bacterium]|nr:exodeoxyribonuclease VII small subunit [Acidimicrobiia bacterium]